MRNNVELKVYGPFRLRRPTCGETGKKSGITQRAPKVANIFSNLTKYYAR